MPLYHQLFIELRRRLLSGEWAPGDPFMGDAEVEEAYGVSRITVRQAVAQLVDENYVIRYRGRGSFVGNLPGRRAQTNHRSVAEEIESIGGVASHRLLLVDRQPVSDLTAQQLDIAVGDEAQILALLHCKDDLPFCLETVILSSARYPLLFERVAAGEENLSQAYARYGIEVAKCDQTVSAVMLSEERQNELGLPNGVPALFVERVGYSADKKPLEVRRLHYRSDIYALRQEIVWGSASRRIVSV
ncbi:MAG: GntR family transcriptional regulator [Paracoccaceae bacterium]|nr:GntR family transcriptional regulator [Paracoccaceae bacterium]